MLVMKFGGTSIQDSFACKRVINIIKNNPDPQKVIVFSAMKKTTRKLLALAQSYAAGREEAVRKIFDDIKIFHISLCKDLISKNEKLYSIVDPYFTQIKRLGNEIQTEKELTTERQDKMLSYGELLSTEIMTQTMKSNGLRPKLLDARDLIITDNAFTCAKPIIKETYEKLYAAITPLFEQNKIPVVQGFIGSDQQGYTTTLGFEGSDFTASLIGAALEADEIQIWKDVPGIMTADPCICQKARSIESITFTEAHELSRAGAKVLHFRTTLPAAEKDIPLRIKHTVKPEEEGTLISNRDITAGLSIKSIACNIKNEKAYVSLIGQGISQRQDFIDDVKEQLKEFTFDLDKIQSPDILTLIFPKADMKNAVMFLHDVVYID